MNNKDKKQLKGMASLMPSVVQIGKDGLSDAVIDSARAAITARELIKAHVLNNANLPTKEPWKIWPTCSAPNSSRSSATTASYSRRKIRNLITNLLKTRT